MRTFIAIELPRQIQNQIQEQQQFLAQDLDDPPIRWVKPESIHLTLKFLGEIPPAKVQEIGNGLPSEADRFASASITVGGLGCFPNFNRPRVVWVGLDNPTGTLKDLQAHLDQWLANLGFDPEKRGFSPHLTIGRLHRQVSNQQRRKIGECIRTYEAPRLGEFEAASVHLFKSDLKPTGAVYTRLVTAPLRGAHE